MTFAKENTVYDVAGEIVIIYAGEDIPDGATIWQAPVETPEQLLAAASVKLKLDAQVALDKVTGASGQIIRCVAAGVAIPAAWTAYVFALRAIANGTDTVSTKLPAVPAFVPNT